MSQEVIEKYQISKIYKYAEHRSGNQISFGWVLTDQLELPAVISYDSKSKSVSPELAAWSKNEGTNAASLKDYLFYFSALIGKSPLDFLSEWEGRLEEFPAYWAQHHENYSEEHGKLIVALAKLLSEEKKFSLHGRTYKIVR